MPTAVKKQNRKIYSTHQTPGAGFIWFLGFIGAFIYYVQQVDNFGAGVVAFLKALAWPAFLVYKLLS
jgi:uncharacterized protein YqhQ